jgi:GR25 family glycosyltransferase involved in LPS biosynthesis
MVKSLGYQIIGTCDTEYLPKSNEFVIYFGNYPDDYMALPQSYQIYRHFLFFRNTPIDRFESNKCWDKIDRIYVMGLEGEFERMNDTWMHLCAMNAPLDRIEEYRAKKDKTLTDIYIGATKNHLDCLKTMKEAGHGCCLFLEDDFVFTSRIRENQESLEKFFEKDYDYNICFLSASKFHERKEYDDLLLESKQICTTSSGYLVSKTNIDTVFNTVREGYELLLENPESSHIYCIDRWWTCLDKLYIFKKKIGFQKPSLSKITGNLNVSLD